MTKTGKDDDDPWARGIRNLEIATRNIKIATVLAVIATCFFVAAIIMRLLRYA